MKKLAKFKWFTFGVIVCLVVTVLVVPAIAAGRYQDATLFFNDIKISLDGEAVVPKTASGEPVEPFAIDGTTYLPVRGIASALGLNVAWDGATNTAVLTTPEEEPDVYMTRTGKKYHHDSTCNGGTYWPVSLETALGFGLEACDKCVH